MIVKIQRPLRTSEPDKPMALVYNRSRTFNAQMPYTADIAALFADGEMKVFHHAKAVKGQLRIEKKRLKDQGW